MQTIRKMLDNVERIVRQKKKGKMAAEFNLSEDQKKMVSTLSQALPFLRKEIGVSQTELANKVGVSRQMISLIERQVQPMSWTLFLAIVFFFKSNNDFDRGQKKIVKKYPNVVEQMMLVEYQMNAKDHSFEKD